MDKKQGQVFQIWQTIFLFYQENKKAYSFPKPCMKSLFSCDMVSNKIIV